MGCKTDQKNSKATLENLIPQKGEVIFYDSLEEGFGINNSNFVLKLESNNQFKLFSFGFNIYTYEGHYKINNDELLIFLKGKLVFYENGYEGKFPKLRFKKNSNGYYLERVDGKSDFKEHWNIYKTCTNIFPLKTNK